MIEKHKEKQIKKKKKADKNMAAALRLADGKGVGMFKSADQKAREEAGKKALEQAISEKKSLSEIKQAQRDAEKKTGENQKKRDLGEKTRFNKALDLTGSLFKDTKEAREAGREAAKQAREEGKSLEQVKQAKKDAVEKKKAMDGIAYLLLLY